ncbi:MAG: ABC transporter permease [Deltaproteobacteria bacterium]|nr:ABC transporter permease [Deltaproteobacteria bacterium]
MDLQLSWRNIWRNPRRTAVILTAVMIGVWCMVVFSALSRGMMQQMVRNSINNLTGHIQIHHAGYRSDPIVTNSISDTARVVSALEQVLGPEDQCTLRVRVGAVANNARHSDGVTLVGILPEQEATVSFIGGAVTEGRYLSPDDVNQIVIGRALAEKFETKIGRKLILMSQDMDLEIASRAFRIVGLFDSEFEATEKSFVFVPIQTARKMLKLGEAASEVAIVLPDRVDPEAVAQKLSERLHQDDLSVETWYVLQPMIKTMYELFYGFIYIWYLVVFIAMGFGIVNTTLMAVFERMREFGLLKALGMKPWRILRGVMIETLIVLILGIGLGNAMALATHWLLGTTGVNLTAFAAGTETWGISRIIYPVLTGGDVMIADGVVFVLGLLVSIYPALKAARFTPIEALAKT